VLCKTCDAFTPDLHILDIAAGRLRVVEDENGCSEPYEEYYTSTSSFDVTLSAVEPTVPSGLGVRRNHGARLTVIPRERNF
jgi:hypothetical protein